jgi:hypothetical protein
MDFKEYAAQDMWLCFDKGGVFNNKLSETDFLVLVVSVVLKQSLQCILISAMAYGITFCD